MICVLLIVDPQNDFITGPLTVSDAKKKMMKLADYIGSDNHPQYNYICVTLDTHSENHSSFKENGGIWPNHCIIYTGGWRIPEYLDDTIKELNVPVSFFMKGTIVDKEEYSIFDNETDGESLKNLIIDLSKIDNIQIDVCGIAGDYCVLETLKGLREFIGDEHIKVLMNYTASIDGGEKLMNYLKENNINYK